MTDLVRMLRSLVWLALFGAIYQELKKPPAERTWHGKVLGVVPYDFRVPDWRRLRDAYWDPSTDRIFNDHVFGVGWAVNIPVAIRRLNAGATQYLAASRRRASSAEPIPLPRSSGERPVS
jgi:hypothetical protein